MSTTGLNLITQRIIGAAIEVHRVLGPGLLESAYEACLEYELNQAGLALERQRALPLTYRSLRLECAYRLDLIVENSVVVEVKALDHLLPVHHAQVISYLALRVPGRSPHQLSRRDPQGGHPPHRESLSRPRIALPISLCALSVALRASAVKRPGT